MADSNLPSFTLSTSFNDQKIASPIPIYLPANLSREQLLAFPAFKHWLTRLLQNFALQDDPAHTFHARPFRVHRIDVEAVVWFGPKPGFMKLQAKVQNYEDAEAEGLSAEEKATRGMMWVPGAVFLRGGSVGVLVRDSEEETYTLLTIQPRIASGSLAFPEIPAGMLDGSQNLSGKAAQEIEEETGLVIHASQMLNMSSLATSGVTLNPSSLSNDSSKSGNELRESIEDAMYPSVGACDEFLPLFLCQKRMARAKLEELKDKKTGLREEGEAITVKVVKFSELWREGGRDGKALAALGLYYSLREKGLLPEWPERPSEEVNE
ncbi:ADP-sugar diphosphatase, partial [Periconia macrospinosa]